MSLMGMRLAVKRYGTPIWIVLALAMIVTSFVGLGAYLGGGSHAGPAPGSEQPVATVGDIKVRQAEMDRTISQYMPNSTPQELVQNRLMLLEQYKRQQAVVDAAKALGITVSDAEIAKARDQRWQQERNGYLGGLGLKEGATDAEIGRALTRMQPGLTVESLKSQYPEDELRVGAYAEKLQDRMKKEVLPGATEAKVRQSYSDIKVRHILVKFGEGALPEAQARSKAQKLLDAIKADPNKMAKLAQENSDDPGSKMKGGLYDWAPASRYVPAFTEAALAVKPGQVNPELVRVSNQGYSGFHIVKLEGVKAGASLPKDFDKDKAKYITQYVDQLAGQKAQEVVTAALPNVKMEVHDPLLRAAQLQQDAGRITDKKAQTEKYNQALAELAKVKQADDPSGMVPFQKASIYEAMSKPQDAIASLEDALKYRNGLDTRLKLAQLQLGQNKKDEAIKQLEEAQGLVRGEINEQFQISMLFKQAGREDLAKTANQKAQDMLKRQQAMNPQGQNNMPVAPSGPPPTPAPAPKTGSGKPK